MSQATTNNTTSRRSALGISAAAIVAGLGAPALTAVANRDAELIQACATAVRCETRLRQIDQCGTSDEDCADATTKWDDAYHRVIDLPASTPAGVRAKAYALQLAIVRENATMVVTNEPIDDIPLSDGGRLDSILARSLCRDILAGSVVA